MDLVKDTKDPNVKKFLTEILKLHQKEGNVNYSYKQYYKAQLEKLVK